MTTRPDLSHHWLPFTANRAFRKQPRMIARARGLRFETDDGHELIDGLSGLFCSPAGHSRPEIADAVAAQLRTLSYCTSFQHGHPGAFELAERVARMLPGDLDHVFFTNSGSEAVETALKIALFYHHSRGDAGRQRLVGRERAYHGMNFGGVSVGGMTPNRRGFGPGLPGVVHLRHTWLEENRFRRGEPETGVELADDLERLCALHGPDTIAACIVEPVAGSTGCLVPPRGYLARLREICDRHGILLIFDEVICGFGRLGSPFAADHFDVLPDVITLAKALTNGAVPMGAVAVRREIHHQIVDSADAPGVELFHGYTYSAHPAACAAGLKTQEIYADEDLFARAAQLSPGFLDGVFALGDLPVVRDVRGIGLIAGMDLAPGHGARAIQDFFDAGVFVKVTGDAVLLAPAFIAEPRDIDEILDRVRAVLARY